MLTSFLPRADLAGMGTGEFAVLLLGLVTASVWVDQASVSAMAEARLQAALSAANHAAASPLPYHAQPKALAGLLASVGPAVATSVLRLEGAERPADACALLGAGGGHAVRVLGAAPECVPPVARLGGPSGGRAAAELGRARWVGLDGRGRVLYSRAELPRPDEMERVAQLLGAGRVP